MILPMLGRWSSWRSRWFVFERVYYKGWRWTPFVRISRRKYFVLSASEALFGFVGWLTSRDEEVMMSGHHEPRVDLIDTFCQANDLPEPRRDWAARLVHPS